MKNRIWTNEEIEELKRLAEQGDLFYDDGGWDYYCNHYPVLDYNTKAWKIKLDEDNK